MQRVEKGWGYELWVVNKAYCGKLLHTPGVEVLPSPIPVVNKAYCGKLLHFRRGKRCSWHYHRLKDEVFYLHACRLRVGFGTTDDLAAADSIILLPGMSLAVPPRLRHQMEAEEDSDLFEFSTHHDEADSIRLAKGD